MSLGDTQYKHAAPHITHMSAHRADSGRTDPVSLAATQGISVDLFSSAELYA